jgi:hypothetical protein
MDPRLKPQKWSTPAIVSFVFVIVLLVLVVAAVLVALLVFHVQDFRTWG